MGAVACLAFAWFLESGMPLDQARNLVLLLMVLFENAHALNARSERQSILRVPLSTNPFLIIAIIGAQALHIGAMFTPGLSDVLRLSPVGALDFALVAVLAVSLILVMEAQKPMFRRLVSGQTPD